MAEALLVDLPKVLGSLKDFQRESVDYVFKRLFLDPNPTHRFLVADEVGLGKTLVAKGIIARTLDHLGPHVKRIDIIYICSNGDIARQNVNRLNMLDEGATLPTRITKLPVKVKDLQKNRVNFISLTPGTSFDLGNSMGQAEERILLYWLLKDEWGFRGRGAQNLLQGTVRDRERFGRRIRSFDRSQIDASLAKAFIHRLAVHAQTERDEGKPDIRARFEELRERFARSKVAKEHLRERAKLVAELRGLLAETCLEALEPDLIILDEFQRFKHLLHGDDGPAALARGMFEYVNETGLGSTKARVLLLSATPYKMYTLAGEAEDDHYRDFVETLGFLLNDAARTRSAEALLKEYRRELFHVGSEDSSALHRIKEGLEETLRGVMVRTERLSVSEDRNGMLLEVPSVNVRLEQRDLQDYVTLDQIASILDQSGSLEYWKSAPYLLNFMDAYQLKHAFLKGIDAKKAAPEIAEVLAKNRGSLLTWRDVTNYVAVDPGNARLRGLMEDTVGRGAWQLLWIPPTFSYYELDGPFGSPELRSFTKRLVFSSWIVAPKVISCLTSYEAERQAMKSERTDARNTQDERRRRRGLLQFARSEGRLTGLPVLGLMYPSPLLAELCDPLTLSVDIARDGEQPSAERILTAAQEVLKGPMEQVLKGAATTGTVDEAWYWAAPILLDVERHGKGARDWFLRGDLARLWAGGQHEEGEQSAWAEHVEHATGLLDKSLDLGRPPDDLLRVLALLGLAAPGVCALRALARVGSSRRDLAKPWTRDAAGRIAGGFRSLFNKPESMAIIRGLTKGAGEEDAPYWRQVLEYSLAGGLQATLDEYAHVLRESEGLAAKSASETANGLANSIVSALTLRTVAPKVDEIRVDRSRQVLSERRSLRGHFALSFGQETSEFDEGTQRPEQVRDAFNSPFWPFVLATTSVGQEGLDFHTYCHAVVHWNLPSNPVDLEQREGRVHRYKGHAIRKNVAQAHGIAGLTKGGRDPWRLIFELARSRRLKSETDLVPYWVFPLKGGAKIERHVPAFPLSREVGLLAGLRRSLAAYRIVFGQPRQDDLVEYLLRHLPAEQLQEHLDQLRIDLAPPRVDVGPHGGSI